MDELIHSHLESDGVLVATIDMPGRSMNVFSAALMDALEALIERAESDAAVHSVVLTSGKPAFLAGADLVMIREFTQSARRFGEAQMFELCGRLGRLFARLEASAKPWVAAVNGLALGGGLELAMACRDRLVADDPRIQLGLPEVRWGLLPGAGGTQRLPRLVGFETGLSLLLSGRSMNPQGAVRLGVFAAAVPAAQLLANARALARSLHGQPWDPVAKYTHLSQADVPAHAPEQVQALARQHGVSDADLRDYPAYATIIDCVLLGARQPLPEASATEMRQFLRLMFDPVAGNMVRSLFLHRQQADRDLAAPAGVRIEQVVLGPLPDGLALWRDALARSRLAVSDDASLAPGAMRLADNQGHTAVVQLATLDTPVVAMPGSAQALLTPASRFGRVLEIVGADVQTTALLAALATRLGGALPYRSGDDRSVLQRLASAPSASALDEQALAALHLLLDGAAADVAQLDVAACAAGISPAWSGGPLTWLWAHHERLQGRFDARARAAWPALAARLSQACT